MDWLGGNVEGEGMKANVGKGVAGFTESQPRKSGSYSEWRRVQQGVAVKPQLIVAEDCLLLSSDSRCSGKTSNNLRLRKGFVNIEFGVMAGDGLVGRKCRRREDDSECGKGGGRFHRVAA